MGKIKKILICGGTRPEWIKLASTIKELKKCKNIETIVINTGQHTTLTNQVLDLFKIKPKYHLKIMKPKQTLTDITVSILQKLTPIVQKEKPDMIIPFADTATAFGTALVGFYNKIPIFHMEGGGRTFNKYDPYPEEVNRKMIDHISDWVTCQTALDQHNLRREKIFDTKVVGNYSLDVIKRFTKGVKIKKQILITMHRRESWGAPMIEACSAIRFLANKYKDYKFVLPMHPNPVVSNVIKKELGDMKNVSLIEALPFNKFVKTLAQSKLIMSDSGGAVQESLFLKKPIINLRKHNEYDGEIDKQYIVNVGKNKKKIISATINYLENRPKYNNIDTFGNGTAGKQTVKWIKEILKVKK